MNDEKIARWQAACERAPTDELARFTLARACFDAGRLEQAVLEFRRALEMQKDWMLARILLGRALMELGRAGEARAELEQARALAIAQGHQEPLAEIEELLEELPA